MNKLIYVIKKIVKFLLPAQFHRFALREYWRLKGELYDEKRFKKKILAKRKSQPIKGGCKVSTKHIFAPRISTSVSMVLQDLTFTVKR